MIKKIFIILIWLAVLSSCSKTTKLIIKVLDDTPVKKILKIIPQSKTISMEYDTIFISLGFDKNLIKVIKSRLSDFGPEFIDDCSNNRNLIDLINSNPKMISVWKGLKGTTLSSNDKLIKYFYELNLEKHISPIDNIKLGEHDIIYKITSKDGLSKILQNDRVMASLYPDRVVVRSGRVTGKTNYFLNEKLIPDFLYIVDGIKYHTDSIGRVKKVSGVLTRLSEVSSRNNGFQTKIVEDYGIKGIDQGGHMLANIFGGAYEWINMFPLNRSLNLGKYKQVENIWRKSIIEGKKVNYSIEFDYTNTISHRPKLINIIYSIDGKRESLLLENSTSL